MAGRRVGMHRLQDLVRLHRMGTGAREVARLLGMSPNTERLYREAVGAEGGIAISKHSREAGRGESPLPNGA